MLKHHVFRTISILSLLLLTVLPSFGKDDYMKLVDRADKAIAKDNYPEAISLLTEALRTEPDNSGNVMLVSNLGMLYYYTGADSLAILNLSVAHEMAPESITILSNRGKVYMETGKLRNALNDFESILELDSINVNAMMNKGVILLTAGEVDSAATVLNKLETLTDVSKSMECSAALAWLASVQGDDQEALKHYSALINIQPSASLYASRAISHVALEHYAEASEDIASGLESDDQCAELYVARAYLNKRTYRNDDAMADAQKAIDLGANRERIRQLLNL